MSFTDSIRSCLTQYVGFAGRARRSEFWYWFLFKILLGIVTALLDRFLLGQTGALGTITGIVNLALLLPSLAVNARRLHDTGRSGWWQLLLLIPVIGIIVLIVFWVQDSHGDNQYGPSPKGATVAGPPYSAA